MVNVLEVLMTAIKDFFALHLVTAWAAKECLTLGQIKVEDHSNEITAIPALLELIDIKGAIRRAGSA